MKKLLSIGLGLSLTVALAATAMAGPSRAILQEMGSTVAQGEVNIDLTTAAAALPAGVVVPYNVTVGTVLGSPIQVNIGALGGEVRYNSFRNSVGYKMGMGSGMALYGNLSLDSPSAGTSTTTFNIGGAYTTTAAGIILNLNPEYTSVGGATTTTSFMVNGAALFPVAESLLLGGEVLYNNNSTTSVTTTEFALGGRWIVSPTVTVDAALYINAAPSPGTAASVLGVPGLVRVNIKI